MRHPYAPEHSVDETVASFNKPISTHAPRILMLYGSLRAESYSRKLTFEAGKILESFGAEGRIYDTAEMPMFDLENYDHPKFKRLTEITHWSEGRGR